MNRKNYMIKFGLSLSLVFILPILIIGYLIATIIRSNFEPITGNIILEDTLILLISIVVTFLITTILGYITYRIDKTDIIEEKDGVIVTGRLMIRKDKIIKIKAKRFIFLYEFVIYTSPYKKLSMLTYYFYDKSELINFINENKLFIEFIRKEDLANLEIDK